MGKCVSWSLNNSHLSPCLGFRESCSASIPWTENRFKSIKVDLTEATKKGWRLDRVQDFTEFFDCKSYLLYVYSHAYLIVGMLQFFSNHRDNNTDVKSALTRTY